MGIQDRDYYRDGPSFLDRVGQQGATVWLIAITCGVYFGQVISTPPFVPGERLPVSPLTEFGAYDPDKVLQGEVWRLLTAVFLHGGLWHLFLNMFVLHWAGGRLEEMRGSRELVLFYLIGGVAANLFDLVAQQAGVAPPARAIGASGAVAAALVAFACFYPHEQLRVYFILPMPAWLVGLLFVGTNCLYGFGHLGGGIAYFVHIGGALFGLLYFQSGVQFSKLFARGEAPRARPRLRVIPPPAAEEPPEPVGAAVEAAPRPARPADEQLEAKLDAVLEKVSKYGRDSLTPEERAILVQASELYKKRRK